MKSCNFDEASDSFRIGVFVARLNSEMTFQNCM